VEALQFYAPSRWCNTCAAAIWPHTFDDKVSWWRMRAHATMFSAAPRPVVWQCALEGGDCLMPLATRLHSLRVLALESCLSMSAAMLEALLESYVQGCKLRVVVVDRPSAEQCAAIRAAVAGRRGSRLTPMLTCGTGHTFWM
jgi:hypothetical protein